MLSVSFVGYLRVRALGIVGLGLAILLADSACATPPPVPVIEEAQPSQPGQATNRTATSLADFVAQLRRSNYLLGDMWGLRPWLSKYGMTLSILETSEVLGNVTGGVQRGFLYDGLTQGLLQLDTQRAFQLYGGTFNVSGLQIHGNNLSAQNLYTFQTASGIEADRATRLWELWYQQKFLSEDRLDVKVGQQSLDQEFMVSQNAGLFVNTMFGWPMLPSADLPGGGAAYPLSAPGVRVRVRPINPLNVLLGVFNGSPVVNNTGDPQRQNPSGVNFPLNGRTLAIAELQYSYPALGGMVYGNGSEPLGRVYKLGFWYDTENFADQEYDHAGLSLANPKSTGIPATHSGDYSIYAVADQMIWRDPKDEDGDRAISFFVRAMGAPEEDRNVIDVSMNAGFTFHEPIFHRDDDTCGVGMGYAKVGNHTAGLDRDTAFYTGGFHPVQSGEIYVEATYQYQLTSWCQLQPDFQYVFNPGAGIANPNAPGQRVKNEAVIGLRMNVLF
jgi:porin